jgi:hypothetical protein
LVIPSTTLAPSIRILVGASSSRSVTVTVTVTVRNHVNQSTDKTFTIKVVDAKKIGALEITSTGNVSVSKNKQKEIDLTANKGGVNFSITGGTQGDKAKFTLSGTTLHQCFSDFRE